MMWLEVSKKTGSTWLWTSEKIKKAFNFSNGTEKDFKRYIANNRQFCIFIEIHGG